MVDIANTLSDKGGRGGNNKNDNYGGRRSGCFVHLRGRGWREFNHHGTRGEDNYRSDDEEDLVVDAADTLSNKGRRGGDNNNNYDG